MDKEKITHDFIEKGLSTIIKEAFNQVLTANGIPVVLGGVPQRFYTEYGKKMLDLLRTEMKYGPKWEKLTVMRHHVEEAEKQTAFIVSKLDLKQNEASGLIALFATLLDPRAKMQVAREYKKFIEQGAQVIQIVDGLIAGHKDLLDRLLEVVGDIDEFLEITSPRNLFDRVLGNGTVGTARNDLCYSGAKLLNACDRLVEVRNQWAERLKLGTVSRVRLSSLEDRCEMIR